MIHDTDKIIADASETAKSLSQAYVTRRKEDIQLHGRKLIAIITRAFASQDPKTNQVIMECLGPVIQAAGGTGHEAEAEKWRGCSQIAYNFRHRPQELVIQRWFTEEGNHKAFGEILNIVVDNPGISRSKLLEKLGDDPSLTCSAINPLSDWGYIRETMNTYYISSMGRDALRRYGGWMEPMKPTEMKSFGAASGQPKP